MRILQNHSDFIEYTPIEKEIRNAEEAEKKTVRYENIVVVFTAVEKEDNVSIAKKAIDEIKESLKVIKCNKILIYPFVHLTNNPASAELALKVLKEMEKYAKEEGLETYRAPFGWNKQYNLKIKGHPLAEQSKVFTKESIKTREFERTPEKINKEYLILTEDGKTYFPKEYNFKEDEEDFKLLVEKEALDIEAEGGGEPEYIKQCKKFGIEWEPMSDSGHMRYGPLGEIIYNLISDYSRQIVNSLGIPVYEVHGTNMFNVNYTPIKEHAELFGDRLYSLEMDKKTFVMRYAACHQQFAMIKDWQISYKQIPFGAFEIADSYRYEQSGETLLCFRLRKFDMPDLHVFCKDILESQEWFFKLHKKVYEKIRDIGRDYVSLYNLTSKEFFEKNIEWFKKLVKFEGKPILLCFYPKGKNYYWLLNIEYHIIDKMKRPREIATVQIDFGNAQRFDIKFIDAEDKEIYPVILHTAIIGSVERYLYTEFDTALRKKNPTLPAWLSPTQIRILPVSDKFKEEAERVADELSKHEIRVDIDDRSDTLQKKIRNSEMDWVPYSIAFGEKEIASGKLAVRIREDSKVEQLSLGELVKRIAEETKGKPFRPLTLPKMLSKRPIFF